MSDPKDGQMGGPLTRRQPESPDAGSALRRALTDISALSHLQATRWTFETNVPCGMVSFHGPDSVIHKAPGVDPKRNLVHAMGHIALRTLRASAPIQNTVTTIAHTRRLILRHLRTSDGDAMHQVLGDPEVMRFGDGVKTPALVRQWISRWTEDLYAQWGFGMWALECAADGRTIGYCGLSRFPDRVGPGETEVGFRLARSCWGRGLASEAVAATRDYAWAALSLPKLVALIDPANLASIRVVEKAGFAYERDAMLDGYDHPDRVYSIDRPSRVPMNEGCRRPA